MTQRDDGHDFRDSKNKAEQYQRQKINNLEDKVEQLQKSIERIHEILAKLENKSD
jgi:predicted ribosome quality control (RQC) complex YloA/Tae2 family protein